MLQTCTCVLLLSNLSGESSSNNLFAALVFESPRLKLRLQAGRPPHNLKQRRPISLHPPRPLCFRSSRPKTHHGTSDHSLL